MAGGFFKRVREGTWMGHVIEHIALEIQTLAGMDNGFGRTRSTGKPGVYNVVFAYTDADAGRYAADAAVRIADALVSGRPYDLQEDIEALKKIWSRHRLGPSTNALVEEARKRNIPVLFSEADAFIQLGYGAQQQRINATVTSATCNIGADLASNKAMTKSVLRNIGVPVPPGKVIAHEKELQTVLKTMSFPVVIKPLDGNQGKGVTTNVRDYESMCAAFRMARMHSHDVICEQMVHGHDYRILVINYKFVAAALRTPACVMGDGRHTIRELVDIVNHHSDRGHGHENVLTRIAVDEATRTLLSQSGCTVDTIPPEGKVVYLKATANLSTGGTATDVTGFVHPVNKSMAERIARAVGLDVCGIDIVAPDLCTPLTDNGGAVLEVNCAPGFRMHLAPTFGKPVNVAAPVIDMLFPRESNGRIPIVAVTGTNGKTTTTRLVAHIAAAAGKHTGYTTTDGVYLDGEKIMSGDCTGPRSARVVLMDPVVEFAVLETARGGILREGLGFDACDIAIVTNIAEDHLGLQGIDTLEKLARVKSVVPESVRPGGYAILNADDDLVYAMRNNVNCNVALFSMEGFAQERIRTAYERGGTGAVYNNGNVVIFHNGKLFALTRAAEIPVTFDGLADFNIANVLAASLAAFLQGIDVDTLVRALKSFLPGPEVTPGRMNVFNFPGYRVIVDYAHNTHALKTISRFISSLPDQHKIGVITGVGDRRDEDIIAIGEAAARLFDKIIIRHDKDLRGRTSDEMNALLCKGIYRYDRKKLVNFVADEIASLQCAMDSAPDDSLIVFFADDITAVLKFVTAEQRRVAMANAQHVPMRVA
jgi:cyanophycin synthetase